MAGNPAPAKMWSGPDGPNPPPKGGRKPGSARISEKTVRVRQKLDEMLGQAHMNVAKALKKGDVPTSRWLIEHLREEGDSRIPKGLLKPLVQALETLDDVAQISKQVLLMAIDGDMTFEQLKFIQEALARHSVLSGVVELRKLREEVVALMEANDIKPAQFGRDHLPVWGRLAKDVTPTHEVDQQLPAE
jgi:urease gamma subunit